MPPIAPRKSVLAPRNFLLALLCAAAACDFQVRPTFPIEAAHQAVIEEQALLGFDLRGDALAAQFLLAEGGSPKLSLILLDRDGGPTKLIEEAPEETARAAADRMLADGARHDAILGAIVNSLWPRAAARASSDGVIPAAPTPPEPGALRWPLPGARALPMSLRIAAPQSGAPAALLVLAEAPAGVSDNDEVELVRMPLAGAEVAPLLWIQGDRAWLLAGSVQARAGEPMHRAVGLRRGSISRGEATLHNQHGLADYAAGELDAARREFDRALRADSHFVDALYNAASVAALEDRAEDAVALLRRAAEEDPRRVQVLARDDDDLKLLRKRPDVRALLGLDRLPPGE